MPSIILSDNGVSSGSAGLKTTAASDGSLALQTTTAGGTATTAVTIDTSQVATFVKAPAGIAMSGPAFSAYKTGTQNITSATWTKISFQTEEFDTASCYDNATNYRFLPNVAGYYQFNWQIDVGATALANALVSIYKNGSEAKRSNGTFVTGMSEQYVAGSALVYLNGSTDYIEVYGYGTSVNTITVYGNGSSVYSYFQGFLARAA